MERTDRVDWSAPRLTPEQRAVVLGDGPPAGPGGPAERRYERPRGAVLEPCECGAPAGIYVTRVCCSRVECDFGLVTMHVSTWNRVMRALQRVKEAG